MVKTPETTEAEKMRDRLSETIDDEYGLIYARVDYIKAVAAAGHYFVDMQICDPESWEKVSHIFHAIVIITEELDGKMRGFLDTLTDIAYNRTNAKEADEK